MVYINAFGLARSAQFNNGVADLDEFPLFETVVAKVPINLNIPVVITGFDDKPGPGQDVLFQVTVVSPDQKDAQTTQILGYWPGSDRPPRYMTVLHVLELEIEQTGTYAVSLRLEDGSDALQAVPFSVSLAAE